MLAVGVTRELAPVSPPHRRAGSPFFVCTFLSTSERIFGLVDAKRAFEHRRCALALYSATKPGHFAGMGIFDRMGKVISSNVNALLDKAEDPKKSVDLIVEEMKDQIRAAKKELVEAVAAEKVLRKKVDDLDAEVQKWERRAELALKAEDEALARDALVQKKRIVADRDRAEALRAEQRAAVTRKSCRWKHLIFI